MSRKIVLDTETTGLNLRSGDRLIEIACIELVNEIPTDNKFHSYINTNKRIDNSAFKVHGISNLFLKDKPFFSEIASDLIDFLGDAKLIAHNASFDISFINKELEYIGFAKIPNSRVIDTLSIARKRFPGRAASLDALCKRFKIDLQKRDKHGALVDAQLLSLVYIELTQCIQNKLDFQSSHIKQGSPRKFSTIDRDFFLSNEEQKNHSELITRLKLKTW